MAPRTILMALFLVIAAQASANNEETAPRATECREQECTTQQSETTPGDEAKSRSFGLRGPAEIEELQNRLENLEYGL